MSDANLPEAARTPLTANVARRLIVAVLAAAGTPMKRNDLAQRVLEKHLSEGGAPGQQHPQLIVKKALGYLREDGKVEKADGFARWRLRDDGAPKGNGAPQAVADEDGDDLDDPYDESIIAESGPPSLKRLGSGSESVYVYYHPNDQELARYKGQKVWECKIGKTESSDPIQRIMAQGARIARSRPPVVALVLLTDDCSALERALHASLRLLDSQVDCEGQEWFTTNPTNVERWYLKFQESLTTLRGQ
jgi:hypothetical protein